jgi:hypothetical protein
MTMTLLSFAWDWSNFDTNVVTALVAVVLGIPTGLLVNRWVEARTKRSEKEAKRVHQVAILNSLKDEIDHNRELLDRLETEYQDSAFYGLDTDLWRAASQEVVAGTSSHALIRGLSRLYHRYGYVQTLLDMNRENWIRHDTTQEAINEEEAIRNILVECFLESLARVRTHAREVLPLLNEEIERLEKRP